VYQALLFPLQSNFLNGKLPMFMAQIECYLLSMSSDEFKRRNVDDALNIFAMVSWIEVAEAESVDSEQMEIVFQDHIRRGLVDPCQKTQTIGSIEIRRAELMRDAKWRSMYLRIFENSSCEQKESHGKSGHPPI
jgi:hypothetical protein